LLPRTLPVGFAGRSRRPLHAITPALLRASTRSRGAFGFLVPTGFFRIAMWSALDVRQPGVWSSSARWWMEPPGDGLPTSSRIRAAFLAPMPRTSASVAASTVTIRSIEPKWQRSRWASAGPTPGSRKAASMQDVSASCRIAAGFAPVIRAPVPPESGMPGDVVIREASDPFVLRAAMSDSGRRRCHRRQTRIKRKSFPIQAFASSSRSGPPTTSTLSSTKARSVKLSKDINIRLARSQVKGRPSISNSGTSPAQSLSRVPRRRAAPRRHAQ
jgi:hypothetical protein